MSWGIVATVGGSILGGLISSDAQSSAADTAAGAQTAASGAQIGEARRQFDAIRELLKPYADTGLLALGAQGDLIGLNGADKQRASLQNLEQSPEFTGLLRQGEEAILANASATGGLRGGNVQGALANFRPQMLAQLINQQYSRLGGLTSIGQNAAAGTGNAVYSTGSQINNALGSIGAAGAGNALAQGRAQSGLANSIGGGVGLFGGMGGFSGMNNLLTSGGFGGGSTTATNNSGGGFGFGDYSETGGNFFSGGSF